MAITKANTVTEIKQKCSQWMEDMLTKEHATYPPGSLLYLLYGGKQPKEQVIRTEMERFSQFFLTELVEMTRENHAFKIDKVGQKEDDLLLKDDVAKRLVYFLVDDNLDSYLDRRCATTRSSNSWLRFKLVEDILHKKHPDYTTKCIVLNWTLYDRTLLNEKQIFNMTRFDRGGFKMYHMSDLFQMLGVEWNAPDFYEYFRGMGEQINAI